MLKKLQTILLLLLICGTAFAQVPNGTFESWTDSLPDNWETLNSGDSLVPITRTTDAHGGTYALRGDVFDFHGGFVPPTVKTKSASSLGYPILARYVAMTGWYKSDLVGTDYITAQVTIYAANGISMGIGYDTLPAAANYTRFYIPISYTGAGVGHYAQISIGMAHSTGPTFSLGSNFIIDDLNLELVSQVNPVNATTFQVEPNPAINQINFNGDFKGGQLYELCLFNSIGELVLKTSVKPGSSSFPPLDVSNLPEGTYLLFISDSNNTSSQRIIISR